MYLNASIFEDITTSLPGQVKPVGCHVLLSYRFFMSSACMQKCDENTASACCFSDFLQSWRKRDCLRCTMSPEITHVALENEIWTTFHI